MTKVLAALLGILAAVVGSLMSLLGKERKRGASLAKAKEDLEKERAAMAAGLQVVAAQTSKAKEIVKESVNRVEDIKKLDGASPTPGEERLREESAKVYEAIRLAADWASKWNKEGGGER